MIPIKVILLSAIVFIAFYMYLRLRSGILDAVLIILFGLIAGFFVLFPDKTTAIAKWLGVNRGINLILYIVSVFFFFLILKLYSKLRKVENKLTELTRKISIKDAEFLSERESNIN